METPAHQSERRRERRVAPPRGGGAAGSADDPAVAIRVRRTLPVLPISDAVILNVSRGGVAIRTRVPLKPGDRLSFTTDGHHPPILAEVLAVEPVGDGSLRVRCRCLLGGFDV
jgi:hypothetical protein